MSSLLETWSALSAQRKGLLAFAAIATIVAFVMLARVATQPRMELLYGNLDAEAAGEVVAALEGRNTPFEVRGDQIFVAAGARDQLRVQLAGEGLPRQGQGGYEIIADLDAFSINSEMFQAHYWRAREGELARTIRTISGVRDARVHIGAGARQPFSRDTTPRTASVSVHSTGGALGDGAAHSIRHLVALAVPGLTPSQVAVIDARTGVVLREGDPSGAASRRGAAERRQERLKQELETLLAARVGEGQARIIVTVEPIDETQTISERRVDPDSQILLSAETSEISEDSTGRNAAVTVASNLPDGEAAAGVNGQTTRRETTEQRNFAYSETNSNRVLEAGGVKRIGVSVFINEVREVGDDGSAFYTPRSAEELAAIEELVKSAMPFDAERGDIVTVESLAFVETAEFAPPPEPGVFEQLLNENLSTLIQLGVLALVALALGLFVVRPILTSGAANDERDANELAPGGDDDGFAIEGGAPGAVGAGGVAALEAGADPQFGVAIDGSAEAIPQGALVGAGTEAAAGGAQIRDAQGAPEAFVPTIVEELREVIDQRRDASVGVLRQWLADETEEKQATG